MKRVSTFYTLISVYWFHFNLKLKCFPCGRSGEFFSVLILVEHFISNFPHVISRQLFYITFLPLCHQFARLTIGEDESTGGNVYINEQKSYLRYKTRFVSFVI